MRAKLAISDGVKGSLSTEGSQSRWRLAAQCTLLRLVERLRAGLARSCSVWESVTSYSHHSLASASQIVRERGMASTSCVVAAHYPSDLAVPRG